MNIRWKARLFLLSGLLSMNSGVYALVVTVPGTSDPWLAGMPSGSTASNGDVAPTHSPVLISGLPTAGVLTFSVTGGVLNFGGCDGISVPPCDGPDGGKFFHHFAGEQNGISDIVAPLNSLLGVFLDDSQPDTSPAPSIMDFAALGTDFVSLSPELKQVFFIGDGLTGTGSGAVQRFRIPSGATRLFLGTMDGYGWYNNTGRFTVTVNLPASPPSSVPAPGTGLLLGSGVFGFLFVGRGRKRNRA